TSYATVSILSVHDARPILLLTCLAVFACPTDCDAQMSSTNRRAQQEYEKSIKHLQRNDYSEAVRDLEKAVALDPKFAAAYQQLRSEEHTSEFQLRENLVCG